MSYDLFFTEPKITLEQFSAYFSGRRHYTVKDGQALYENEDTGVYFWFDYLDDSEGGPEAPGGSVSFGLNFIRPHFFALEAEPEVRHVVDYFGFKVYDPQPHGMGNGPYSREAFLDGWNRGNEFAHYSIMNWGNPPRPIYARPREELEAIWRWNYARQQLQSRLGDDIFVPKIMFVEIEGSAHSVVVWPDVIPIWIPQVDTIIILRQKLAPRRLFKQESDICLVPFSEMHHFLKPFESTEHSLPSYHLSYTQPPKALKSFVKALHPYKDDLQGIPMDRVLDRELVER